MVDSPAAAEAELAEVVEGASLRPASAWGPSRASEGQRLSLVG